MCFHHVFIFIICLHFVGFAHREEHMQLTHTFTLHIFKCFKLKFKNSSTWAAQNSHIHGCVFLMPWAFLSSKWASRPARFTAWSHYGMLVNVVPNCIWLYKMHCTHQPYKQIWAHPLPNGHLLWQLKERQPHFKPFYFFYNKPNVRINIWMKVIFT